VTWSVRGTEGGCSYKGGPSTFPLQAGDAYLDFIRIQGSPVAYFGAGHLTANLLLKVTCPGEDPLEVNLPWPYYNWFLTSQEGTPMGPDPRTIQDTFSDYVGSFTWNLHLMDQ
jgi:hypothetical protein